MTVYNILLAAILLFGGLLCIRKPSKLKNIIYLVLIFGYMWFLASFRYGIGFDYQSYINIADQIRGVSDLGTLLTMRREPGFTLLTKLITLVTDSSVVMYGIYSALILIPIGIFIFRQCKNVWLSTWLYITLAFFYTNMNFIRQSLALAVFVFAYDFLRNKKFIPFLLITLLAATFHATVLIMIPIYFLAHVPLNRTTITVYCSTVAVLFILSKPILYGVTRFIFTDYWKTDYLEEGFSLKFMLVPVTALIICISLFHVWKERDPDAPLLLNLVILSSTIWLFSMRHMILERFSMYNYIFLLIAIPSALQSLQASPTQVEERDALAHQIDTARGKPRQQDVAALEKMDASIADGRVYYWSAVAAVLIVTLIYNSFGMHVNGFHQVFPYQSVLEWFPL